MPPACMGCQTKLKTFSKMNFALILFLLTVFTGIMWLAEKFYFRPRRKAFAEERARAFEAANREAIDRGEAAVIQTRNNTYAADVRMPWWLDYTAGLFPVILIVFLLRSFLFEPFRIPSGSMLPTLYIGDFILVNKYTYGVRLPVVNTKIIDVNTPERGDVMVFRYPMDESMDYIKRVVGLPGDTVSYINKEIRINGEPVKQTIVGDWVDPFSMVTLSERTEKLGEHEHRLAVDNRYSAGLRGQPYPRVGNACRYYSNGFVCKVPENQYFVMGDNRDNSEDSRYWGFVTDDQIVGKAVAIWANFSDMSRVGSIK